MKFIYIAIRWPNFSTGLAEAESWCPHDQQDAKGQHLKMAGPLEIQNTNHMFWALQSKVMKSDEMGPQPSGIWGPSAGRTSDLTEGNPMAAFPAWLTDPQVRRTAG